MTTCATCVLAAEQALALVDAADAYLLLLEHARDVGLEIDAGWATRPRTGTHRDNRALRAALEAARLALGLHHLAHLADVAVDPDAEPPNKRGNGHVQAALPLDGVGLEVAG